MSLSPFRELFCSALSYCHSCIAIRRCFQRGFIELLVFVDRTIDSTLRRSGPLYVAVCVGLTLSVTLGYILVLLPLMTKSFSTLAVCVHFSFAMLLVLNIFFNYFLCVVTSPGEPSAQKLISDPEYANIHLRFCRKCGCIKPPRTHHCSVCQKCVLKMDHHCPWINGCVGFRNYRYFILFLVYLFLGSIYATLTASYLLLLWFSSKDFSTTAAKLTVYILILSSSVAISLFLLLSWHFYLICTGQTTIEFYENRERKKACRALGRSFVHEYDLGLRENLKIIFGSHTSLWKLLMPSFRPLDGDGYLWDLVNDRACSSMA